jgi:replicative DNA helicase
MPKQNLKPLEKQRKYGSYRRRRQKFLSSAIKFFNILAETALADLEKTKNIDDFNMVVAKLNIGKQLIAYANFTVDDLLEAARKDVRVMKNIQDTALNYIAQVLEKSKSDSAGSSTVTVNFLNLDPKKSKTEIIEGSVEKTMCIGHSK